MNNKVAKFFIPFVICMGFSNLQAQEVVLSANGNATGNTGTVSYSVGQVAYLTKSGTSGIITEGVQQPYEIIIPAGIDDKNGITLECYIYPNPASRYVKLKIENHEIKNLNCQLLNMNGLPLQQIKVESEESYIPMDDLAKATYFLIISENGKTLKTIQVIKK
jgi:hypothetical protein